MLSNSDLAPFIGGQIQIASRRSETEPHSFRGQIARAFVTADHTLVVEYDWTAIGEGDHWITSDRVSDLFVLIDFDDPVSMGGKLLVKNKAQTIFFFPAGDESLVKKENVLTTHPVLSK